MTGIVLVLALTAAIVVGSLVAVVKNLLYVSAPNQALIFSGTTRRLQERVIGFRVVRGGRALRVPLLERVDRMDLNNIPIEIKVNGAFSKGGIPLNVHGVANVKLPGEEPLLFNAVERFLGCNVAHIQRIARETLEGNVRGVLAQLTPEQVNEDKMRFAQTLLDEAEHDLNRMGLVLDTLKIQNVTDEVGYLNSIGRIRGARIRMTATIAEASAEADAAEQQARNWAASEVAKVDADLAIAQQDTQKRIVDAQTRREAMIAEAQGQVAAQIAQVRAEVDQQKARAPQVRRQLDADVVQPAEADRRAKEEAARGQAASIVERGKAEATALRKLVESYLQAGQGARDLLLLQQLMPIVNRVAGADQKLNVSRVSFVPGAQAADRGDTVAKAVIGASAQLQAAGVDLPGLARALSGERPA